MKTCSVCGKTKPLSDFQKRNDRPCGVKHSCKDCGNKYVRAMRKTPIGRTIAMYQDQIKSSKDRGHPKPSYSREWLTEWLMSKQQYHMILSAWANSDYCKSYAPSIDRIDCMKPYPKDNIRLTTWGDNNAKGRLEFSQGKTTAIFSAVCQMDMNENVVNSFFSIAEASRQTGIRISGISSCCSGAIRQHKKGPWITRSAGGYKWKYTKDLN